ncbi:MAG: hypothetical protein R2815_00440 [Flavobacteriales bacterium]
MTVDRDPSHRPDRTFGGFIGLEKTTEAGGVLHADGSLLSSGRACIAAILDQLKQTRRAYLPFYTCDSAIVPFIDRGIEVVHYGIDSALMPVLPDGIKSDEVVVVNDTFGVLGDRITELGSTIAAHVIHDDTHAFYVGRRSDRSWAFNSARKFCGVPDGGFLFAPMPLTLPQVRNVRVTTDHLVLRALGSGDAAYRSYQVNEERISSAVERASLVSETLLSRMDHVGNIVKRKRNFMAIHNTLGNCNRIQFFANDIVPYCYPYLPDRSFTIDRRSLSKAGLFIPTLWTDVLNRSDSGEAFSVEKDLSRSLLALPVDQRYTEADMVEMVKRLTSILQ